MTGAALLPSGAPGLVSHAPARPVAWKAATICAAPELAPGNVHVWWVSLDVHDELLEALQLQLSDAEHHALAHSRSVLIRRRRTMSRAWRRLVLAAYMGEPPTALRFATGANGKPALLGDAAWLQFSIAHHGPDALLAVANSVEVGVDLEAPPAELDAGDGWWLSPNVAASLRGSRPAEWALALAREWVQLEARAKLRGHGLARASETPSADAPWMSTFLLAGGAGAAAPELLGALACCTPPARLRWLRLQTD